MLVYTNKNDLTCGNWVQLNECVGTVGNQLYNELLRWYDLHDICTSARPLDVYVIICFIAFV